MLTYDNFNLVKIISAISVQQNGPLNEKVTEVHEKVTKLKELI